MVYRPYPLSISTDDLLLAVRNVAITTLAAIHWPSSGVRHQGCAAFAGFLLEENNIRKGFFEQDQFDAVLRHPPEGLRPVVQFAYITGWRIKSEVLSLEWRQVDFKAGTVRLEPGTTKNRRAGRSR